MSDQLIVGSIVAVTPEKPVAGGRMLARLDGRVLLVAGAIPGERVRVRVERVERSMAFASVEEILEPHPARRRWIGDPKCGGAAYAHIDYPEQVRLKSQVIRDGLVRLARIDWPDDIPVAVSPERGYRMRARLHVRDHRIGFFLEGTHSICAADQSGQLLPATIRALDGVRDRLLGAELHGDADVEISENIVGDMRAVHIDLEQQASLERPEELGPVPDVTGLSWSHPGVRGDVQVCGSPLVVDQVAIGHSSQSSPVAPVALQRHVKAFFQGNRYLLGALVNTVIAGCADGPVVDLYAGVGLFGVSLAASGRHTVTAVEGHPASAADLKINARPYSSAISVLQIPVEEFVRRRRLEPSTTLVLDPPRSGMSREAAAGAVALGAGRVVFVSCDVATFGRDLARFLAAGYRLISLQGFDLFPSTPHVEAVAVLERA